MWLWPDSGIEKKWQWRQGSTQHFPWGCVWRLRGGWVPDQQNTERACGRYPMLANRARGTSFQIIFPYLWLDDGGWGCAAASVTIRSLPMPEHFIHTVSLPLNDPVQPGRMQPSLSQGAVATGFRCLHVIFLAALCLLYIHFFGW